MSKMIESLYGRPAREAHRASWTTSWKQAHKRTIRNLGVPYTAFMDGMGARLTVMKVSRTRLTKGILAELVPHEPEANGLASLMEIQASRLRSRVGADGKPVLLLDQDRTKWDRLLISRGFTALERAEKLGKGLGSYGCRPPSQPAMPGLCG